MKTAREVCDRAFAMLGYVDRIGNYDEEKFAPQYKQSMQVCQTIIDELSRVEGVERKDIESLDDELNLSDTSINLVMPYGLAMWYAQMDGDGTNQQIFSLLYNQKMGLVPKPQKTVTLNYSPNE